MYVLHIYSYNRKTKFCNNQLLFFFKYQNYIQYKYKYNDKHFEEDDELGSLNKLLEKMTTRYNETRTATRKENKIKSLFYSIRDLWLRETAGAKLYRRWRWRNSWNPWRNVRSSITESVLEDFSHSFLFSYFFRSRNILIAAEFNTRESYAPGTRQFF